MVESTISEDFYGPLFIVGMPRSGTKLLRDLLNRHPKVFIPRVETEFLPALVNDWSYGTSLEDESEFERFYLQITKLPYFSYTKDQNRLIELDVWNSRCLSFSPEGVFEALIKHDSGYIEGGIWGDKSPSYINAVAKLKAIYPKAKFIHIIRDVRDYVVSINNAWQKNRNRAAYRWGRDVMSGSESIQLLNEDGIEIKYEELISNPRKILEQVCLFLSIQFDDRMLQLKEPAENIGDAKGHLAIKSDNRNKYKQSLSADQLRSIEELAFDTMIKHGYKAELAKNQRIPSKVALLFQQILDGFQLVRSVSQERGLIGALSFHLRYFLNSANRRANS